MIVVISVAFDPRHTRQYGLKVGQGHSLSGSWAFAMDA